MLGIESVAMVTLAAFAAWIAFTRVNPVESPVEHRMVWLPEAREAHGEDVLRGH